VSRKHKAFLPLILFVISILAFSPVGIRSGQAADDSILGVTIRGEWADPPTHALAVDGGARWVRTSVNWSAYEPVQGQRNLSALDGFFKSFTDLGLKPIVFITDNPSWAASSKCGPLDKAPLQALADFMRALAERYDGDGDYDGDGVVDGPAMPKIDYWALYNEPDNRWTTGEASTFGGCWGRNGGLYAQLLKLVRQEIQRANPDAQMVFSGVAGEKITCPNTWTCAGEDIFNFNIAGGDFVDAVLGYIQGHPGEYFDVFDFHYYPSFHGQWDSWGKGILGKAAYYQDRLASHGLNKPMICTETGRRSDAGQVIDEIPGSDAEQSKYLVKTYIRAMAGGLQSVLWFSFADFETGAWGLLDVNHAPKPSYTVYKVLSEQMEGATFQSVPPLATGQEGYAFLLPNGEKLWVVWGSGNITIPSMVAQRINRNGVATTLTGAQGAIVVTLGDSPLYFRFAEGTQYVLTIAKNGSGSGTVSSDPAGPNFAPGTVVTLTATPKATSTFAGWSGGCTGTSSTCQATMNNNVSVTATFNLKTYTITATAGPNGSISPAGEVAVNPGSSITFAITPNQGFMVADVIIDGTSRGPKTSKTFTKVAADHSLAATFAPGGPGGQVVFAINAGGAQYTAQSGIVYKADTNFSGGQIYSTTASIAGTSDGPLYQRERFGNFAYNIPVANGNYNVTLKFAELSCSAASCRVFNVKMEGRQVIGNLDLFAKVGKNRAYDITIPVTVTDGKLTIEFYSSGSNAKVNAILVTSSP
jgi:hypothetical protein